MRLFLVGLRLTLRISYCFFDRMALRDLLGCNGGVKFEEMMIVVCMNVGGAIG